jgi:aminopeptidase N
MLGQRVAPHELLDAMLRALPREDTEQIVQLLAGYARAAFWRFLPTEARATLAPRFEQALRTRLESAPSTSMKGTVLAALRSTALTPDGVRYLERIWRRDEKIAGLPLSESDDTLLALDLAVRSHPDAAAILEEQRARLTDPDRRARFEFVSPAVSQEEAARDEFFERLRLPEHRRHEPWVIEGLQYFNHPLRAQWAERHLRASLDLLADVQRTGDIFFPANWMHAVLNGHNTPSAARIVRAFLAERPDPLRLRRLILQAADDLFRSVESAERPGLSSPGAALSSGQQGDRQRGMVPHHSRGVSDSQPS